ncbi:metal-dependent hydrolase [Candidatus Poribacteria bacterium]|nr:metal-dependent hydrolase [Candidatus Poribacteria bacterium]
MSMFREHWIGGLVAYSTFFVISLIATFAVPIFYDGIPQAWNPTIPPVSDLIKIIGCFVVAVLFGLWPDVDIKSKSQKIFYRVLFVLNVVLIVFLQKYLLSALLGLFAMLPIMSKHRGWTHARITMILLPVVFLLIPIYTGYPEWQSTGNLVDHFNALQDWDYLPHAILSGLPFYVAGFIGYATHLHLDGILFRSRKAQRQKARVNQ